MYTPKQNPIPPGVIPQALKNAEPRRGVRLSATLSYFVPKPGGGQGNLCVNESAEPDRPLPGASPSEAWRAVDDFLVAADDSMGYLRCKVVLEREGTHIRLESTAMQVHELVDPARSLVPLSTGGPSAEPFGNPPLPSPG
jgi:hypothetical protein